MRKRRGLARLFRRRDCPECGNRARDAHCDVCGYDLVRRDRERHARPRPSA